MEEGTKCGYGTTKVDGEWYCFYCPVTSPWFLSKGANFHNSCSHSCHTCQACQAYNVNILK